MDAARSTAGVVIVAREPLAKADVVEFVDWLSLHHGPAEGRATVHGSLLAGGESTPVSFDLDAPAVQLIARVEAAID